MKNDESLQQLFYNLETKLLKPEIRHAPEEVARLLADNFIEIGSSGKVYTKKQIIEELAAETDLNISIEDFRILPLSDEIVLATYKAFISVDNIKAVSYSWRSSIWKFDGENWRMAFHQGTMVGSR